MAARAIWKGVLKLGEQELAVKLYSAVQDRDVHFKLLERKSHAPVEQRMVKPESDEAIAYADIRKGFLSEGSYVLLDKEELSALAPKPSREIAVEAFVRDDKLGPEWFVRPYYLGPDGDADGYAALARTLAESEREGVAHWVMRGIEYAGVLRSTGEQLMLITLRHKDEVVSTEDLAQPEARAHSEKEASMAEQLINAYAGEFDADEFKNEHRERVLSLIEAKAKGKRLKLSPVHAKRAAPSLADALEKSLQHLKRADAPTKASKKTSARGAARKKSRKEPAVA